MRREGERDGKDIGNKEQEPIYFFADSNDLVKYMAHDLNDATGFITRNEALFEMSPEDVAARDLVQSSRIVARNVSLENAHLDKQMGREREAYYGTFLDLFLAMNARCVVLGVGNYALFATKLAGSQSCALVYQEEAWGKQFTTATTTKDGLTKCP